MDNPPRYSPVLHTIFASDYYVVCSPVSVGLAVIGFAIVSLVAQHESVPEAVVRLAGASLPH